MNTIVIAIALAFFGLACDSTEPSVQDATGAVSGSDGAADPCAIPDGYTLVITSCTAVGATSTCIAQDSAFRDAPAGTTKINLAGCPLSARPTIVCVATCQ